MPLSNHTVEKLERLLRLYTFMQNWTRVSEIIRELDSRPEYNDNGQSAWPGYGKVCA